MEKILSANPHLEHKLFYQYPLAIFFNFLELIRNKISWHAFTSHWEV